MPVRTLIMIAVTVLLWGCSVPRGVYHTVRAGQTLFRISQAYGVDERYLARINGIDDPTHLQIGDRLFIPGAKRHKRVSSTANLPAPPEDRPSITRKVAVSPSSQPTRAAAPVPTKASPPAQVCQNQIRLAGKRQNTQSVRKNGKPLSQRSGNRGVARRSGRLRCRREGHLQR